ncbi:MAG: hypothetical protein HY736_14365 [Verrucomicrobia bacterium]|nr:hypothetical protein [Verrucomicrobiota bacterium]
MEPARCRRVRANGQLPGHVFRTGAPSLDLMIDGRLDSRDPIAALELVRNGRVERIALPARVTMQESGWFLVRAIAGVAYTFRFASTGPFYVELGNAPAKPERASARFFVEWCDEWLSALNANPNLTAAQREDVLQPWREARAFWLAKFD